MTRRKQNSTIQGQIFLILSLSIYIFSKFVIGSLDGVGTYSRFYVGGSFSLEYDVTTNNSSSVTYIKNVAYWSNNQWNPLGDGFPNGEVYTVTTDLCRNVCNFFDYHQF